MIFQRIRVYAFFLMIVALVVFLGSMIGGTAESSWYENLYKPTFTPPKQVFMIVWPILYVLMAIVGGRLYLSSGKERQNALNIWLIQLVVTGAYSYLFFALESPVLGFLNTLVLVLLVALLLLKSYRLDKMAFWFLIPYFCWICFALVLGGVIVIHPWIN